MGRRVRPRATLRFFFVMLTMPHPASLFVVLSSFVFHLSSFIFHLSSFVFYPPVQPAKPPVLATVEAVRVAGAVKVGEPVTLAVKITPRKGIHVYAPPEQKYKPVTLRLQPAAGVRAGQPKYPVSTFWTFDGEKVRVYDAPFVIEVPVTVAAPGGRALTVRGELQYQACDDLICYLPIKVPLSWVIRIQ